MSAGAAVLAEIQRESYAEATAGFKSAWPEHDALDEAQIAGLLRRNRYCVLATGRADGRAHAAPVAFVLGSDALWFATVSGLRLRNLRTTPWASLVVMEGQRDEDEPGTDPPHRALTAEGPVVLHEGEAFAAAFEPIRPDWIERHGHPPDWAVALAELRPVRVFSHAADAP
ncbi:MAG TPA: pyridoxamine 5'-phosphate oxidase family protein [Gaiellaceae bacterium]|nr:pyridoxamine 5'-phosphate oxidase family protein [Gaiellaceae bacterium]